MKKAIVRTVLVLLCLSCCCFLNSCSKSGGTKISKTETTQYAYVASSQRDIFHKPTCRWADKISESNLTGFKTRDEAVKSGRRPCKVCNP